MTKKTSEHSPYFSPRTNHLVTLKLPYPPSLNRYYRTYNGRPTISAEGRKYKERIAEILKPAFYDLADYSSNLQVWIEVMFPDRRRRDLDNLNKCLLDSLTTDPKKNHVGVWEDDSLIHDLRLVRIGVEKPGFVRLHIAEIKP